MPPAKRDQNASVADFDPSMGSKPEADVPNARDAPAPNAPALNPPAPSFAEDPLAELDQELNRLQRSIRLAIQAKLATFAGHNFGSLAANQQFATRVAQLLDSHGLRVRCNECGHSAILRVSPRGKSSGVFVFDHTIDGKRTFHGGKSQMPLVQLTGKPPRKKTTRKRAS